MESRREFSLVNGIILLLVLLVCFVGICVTYITFRYSERKIESISDSKSKSDDNFQLGEDYQMTNEPFDDLVDTDESPLFSDHKRINPYVVSKESIASKTQ